MHGFLFALVFFVSILLFEKESILMKKLNLPIRFNDDNVSHKYSINFPDRKILYFKSKRKAEDFVRTFSKFVSDTIRSSFDIHVSLYSIYLQNCFSMPLYETNDLKISLDGFLDISTKWSQDYGEGWQSLKLIGFFSILNHIEDSALKLKSYFKSKKDYFHVNRIDSSLQMVYFFYEKYNQIFSGVKTSLDYKSKTLSLVTSKRDIC